MRSHYLRYINSYQKLKLLLFFHTYPSFRGSLCSLAEKLYEADHIALRQDIQELVRGGLIEFDGRLIYLSATASARQFITHLAEVYNDPLDRQIVLDMVTQLN